jgi:hypothetical protein
MEAVQQTQNYQNISGERIAALVGELFGGYDYPNPDDPQPPGPWDPYIHKGLNALREQLERRRNFPHEEAWRTFIRLAALGREEIWDAVIPRHVFAELNPQPLPLRALVLATIVREYVEHALLIQETADAINETAGQQGGSVIGGRMDRLAQDVDELCPRIPKKFPKPKGGSETEFSGLELVAASAVFRQIAATVTGDVARQELENVGGRILEKGLARM